MTMRFNGLAEFEKELKRLSKKYRSLPEDLEEFKKVISVIPLGNSKHFTVLHSVGTLKIVKARLFCRYLKGTSLRVIYSFDGTKIEFVFIELYFKGDKENEDRERIKAYLKDV